MGQCPYYKGNLVCGATNQSVNTTTRDYTCYKDYSKCQYYKSASSGGCYLTSACMEARQTGFDDNCFELMTLRSFRDSYVMTRYPDAVKRYYAVAPKIVEAIEKLSEKSEIYADVYDDMVLKTTDKGTVHVSCLPQ